MRTSLAVLGVLSITATGLAYNKTGSAAPRDGKAFSLFSIVQFPNQQCTGSSSTSTYGTCYTSSECTTKGGSADGNCAAGFGVCCVITTSTCGSTISTNTTYIRNPNYPSSYTATSAGTCAFTIKKVSDDVCQLGLDFQTFSGFATTTNGVCNDKFTAEGQTGKNPPDICGTNTGYHMYVEFGATSTDSVTLTNTYVSGGLTTAKTFNILARQISCTATYKAPTDCTQYFTGKAGNVKSYNFGGGQLIQSLRYTNCIRTEEGYCAIQWKESSTTSPDPFEFGVSPPAAVWTTAAANGASGTLCEQYVLIPGLSPDGTTKIPAPPGVQAFQSQMCGEFFGLEHAIASEGVISMALVSKEQPFIVGVYTDTDSLPTAVTGFNLDYTQLPC